MPVDALARPATWDDVAHDYVDGLSPMFEGFARTALAAVPPGPRCVDVAAGPGSLARLAAATGARVDAIDFSAAMLAQLRALPGGDAVAVQVADAAALPFPDATFDAGYVMFGVMFFPDRAAALAELRRVVRPGGRVALASWTPPGSDPGLGALLGAFGQAMVDAGLEAGPMRPQVWTDPEVCRAELAAAGFDDVSVTPMVHVHHHPGAAESLAFFARTTAPIRQAALALGDRWPRVLAAWTARFAAAVGPGPVSLGMRALLTTGRAA